MELHEDMQEFSSGGMLSPRIVFSFTNLHFISSFLYHFISLKINEEWLILLKGYIQMINMLYFHDFFCFKNFEQFSYRIQAFCSQSSVPQLFLCLSMMQVLIGEKAHMGSSQIFPTWFLPIHEVWINHWRCLIQWSKRNSKRLSSTKNRTLDFLCSKSRVSKESQFNFH